MPEPKWRFDFVRAGLEAGPYDWKIRNDVFRRGGPRARPNKCKKRDDNVFAKGKK